MFIKFTYVDALTGIPVTEEPAKNGPAIPSISGVAISFCDESQWPKPYPVFYGTCDEETDPATPGIIAVLTQEEFESAEAAEMEARFNRARSERIDMINSACDREINELVKSYPEREIASWPQQVKEATDYTADNNASTPLLSAIATSRDSAVSEIAAKAHEKATQFSIATGAIIGKRQALINAIEDAETIEQIRAVSW